MKGGRLQLVCIVVGSRARAVDVGRGGWGEGGIIRACLWVGYSVHRRYCVHSQVTYTRYSMYFFSSLAPHFPTYALTVCIDNS